MSTNNIWFLGEIKLVSIFFVEKVPCLHLTNSHYSSESVSFYTGPPCFSSRITLFSKKKLESLSRQLR